MNTEDRSQGMRKILIVLPLLFWAMFLRSQVAPSDLGSAYRLASDTGIVSKVRERLVQLALQNPGYEIADHYVTIAEYNIRLARTSWLSQIILAGNLNEFSINPAVANGASVYYPRYNFGIVLPLDIFSRTSNNSKIAYEQYQIAQAERRDTFRLIRGDVLERYEDFLYSQGRLQLQYEVANNAYEAYNKAEADFKNNLIKLDQLNLLNSRYIDETVRKLEFLRDYNVSKIYIEKATGKPLDEVVDQIRNEK